MNKIFKVIWNPATGSYKLQRRQRNSEEPWEEERA
ncbi:ESPR-type extended signal peptide-containing protein [Escherichia albertii]